MSRLRQALPPLSTLLPFEAAARHQSFLRAAQELSLTQAAISRRIRALEESLGVALFERRHRQVVLTEAGRTLAEAVAGGLIDIAECAQRLRHRQPPHEVVLFAELYVAMYWLVPRLNDFHRRHPRISVRINASSQPLVQAMEPFDLAMQCTDRPSGLLAPLLSVPDEVFPVCSPALTEPHAWSIETLLSRPLLHYRESDNDAWMSWRTWLDRVGHPQPPPAPTSGQLFDSYPVMLQAAMNGHGVCLGYGGIGQLVRKGELVRPVVESIRLDAGMSVYRARHADDRPAVDSVLDWLAEILTTPERLQRED
ncbi:MULTISPECIES: LysR family transcriptional regulator [unclassified Modicisalibacter]|uniref:LysR family transcriptional regulator n=1 Tax=unclassified Modicisalibacter TaxID=2679913 RepID=UPI001CCC698F|nr:MULTISPECIES: LysR family transcriptional regulator [unclassified Modicisalibacter]MBZ9558388.1 LysR family transcriptional regulator [Modicisalibacter sp. R2A 31.J]MBZ9575720.1 LysR family transcriptional regulator [Modicisalibacter sp. MOD 31.J]